MNMSEPKPLASLSGSLLARKGQAAPAMRRQSMLLHSADHGSSDQPHNPLEDLGWNDMGDLPEPTRSATGLSPMPILAPVPTVAAFEPATPQPITPDVKIEPSEPPAVVRQQEELAREVAAPTFEPEPVVPSFVVPEPVVEDAPVFAEAPQPAVEAPAIAKPVAAAVRQAPVVRAAPGSRGKAAFTLRLDSERHLKLRLVCAVRHRSAQQIVTEALDMFLAQQPSEEDMLNGRVTKN
jgi:hypothetical protein